MKKMIKCVACGRNRKPGHEKRCGTKKAYNEKCVRYEDVADWKKFMEDKIETERMEKEAKEKEIKEKAEREAKEKADSEKAEKESKELAEKEALEKAAQEVKPEIPKEATSIPEGFIPVI